MGQIYAEAMSERGLLLSTSLSNRLHYLHNTAFSFDTMSKNVWYTIRQVLDKVFADKDSDYINNNNGDL